jgi:hypothetical protein
LPAQVNALSVVTPPRIVGQRNGVVLGKLSVRLSSGFHVNSHAPNDEYLIPMRLTWNAAPLEVLEVVFPKPKQENYPFSDKPVSVFTGDFDIVTKFKVPADALPGPAVITGKLRYQACTEALCLPPKSIEVRLPVQIQ